MQLVCGDKHLYKYIIITNFLTIFSKAYIIGDNNVKFKINTVYIKYKNSFYRLCILY